MYQIYKTIYHFFDKVEDHVRGWLSGFPIFYAIIGGIGIVLFWRGVWHTVDYFMFAISATNLNLTSIDLNYGPWWDGPLSFVVGLVTLLMTGVFVSNFIGNEILISGLKGEKKVAEKTKKELEEEGTELAEIQIELQQALEKLNSIQSKLDALPQKQATQIKT